MINHILLICSTVIIYEFIIHIKFKDVLKSNLKIYQKILKLIQYKNVSDFRKEKLILNYSKSLFKVSVKIFVIIISIVVFMIILNFLFSSYLNFVMSILGIIELSIFFLIYHFMRKKIYAVLQ